mgnify:CR=1 FL=1
MARRRVSCIGAKLSTGYPQGPDDALDEQELEAYSGDLMDVPDLFVGIGEGIDERMARTPQVRRRPARWRSPAPQGGLPTPRRKDQSVVLPTNPVMAGALAVAERRGDIITSGEEGAPSDRVHAPTSQHYQGTALDVRFAGDRQVQARAYAQAGYVTVIEKDHLHVQKYRVA